MCLRHPAGVAGFAACSSTTTATVTDGGTDARAKTKDGGKQAGNDASAEASCAVDAGPLQDAEIKLGLALVTSHGCFTCHGGALEGNDDGVQSTVEGGVAYPPNLTPDPATGLGCWTNAQIKNAFLNGFDNMDAAICNPMPHFGHIAGEAGLNDAEATAVVQFLRSIPPLVNNPPNTPSCRLSWDAEMDTGGGGPVDAGRDAGSDARRDAPVLEAGHDAAAHETDAHDGGAHDAAPGDGARDGRSDGHD